MRGFCLFLFGTCNLWQMANADGNCKWKMAVGRCKWQMQMADGKCNVKWQLFDIFYKGQNYN